MKTRFQKGIRWVVIRDGACIGTMAQVTPLQEFLNIVLFVIANHQQNSSKALLIYLKNQLHVKL